MTSPSSRYLLGRRPAGALMGLGAVVVAALAAGSATVTGDPRIPVLAAAGLAAVTMVVLDARWALAALGAFVVLRVGDVATDFHGVPSTFLPLIAALAVGIAARWAVSGERPRGAGPSAILVGAYVLVAAGTLLFSSDPAAGRDPIELLAKDASVAVLAGILLSRASSLRMIVWVTIGCGALLGGISVLQFLTGSASEFGGLGQWSVENIVGTYDDVRVSGPVGDPNFYGQLLVVILPLALDRMWAERSRRLRWLAGIASLLVAAAIVFTFSRGAALAMAVVGLMMIIAHRPSLRSLAAIAVLAALTVPLLPPGYTGRLSTITQIGTVEGGTDVSIRGRTAELTAGWLMFLDNPLSGVGYGAFGDHYLEYVTPAGIEQRREMREAHNLYLEVAAETGIPGTMAFTAVVVGAFVALRRARRRFAEIGMPGHAGIARALTASLVGFLIAALFLHLDFAGLFWLLIGVALAAPRVADREAAALGAGSR